ncbi:hypothetical protein D3C72_1387760 [compost metagenome]
MRHGVLAAQHDGLDVDRLHQPPVLQRVLLGPDQFAADAGVVHQNGQAAHVLGGGGDHADPVVLARHVVLIGERRARMLGVDTFGQGSRPVQVAVGNGDLAAFPDQHSCHGLTQTTRRAGDQGSLARNAPAHSTWPLTASSMKRAMATSRSVTPPASWVVSSTSTRL